MVFGIEVGLIGSDFGKADDGGDENRCTDGLIEKHVAGDLVCAYSDMGL